MSCLSFLSNNRTIRWPLLLGLLATSASSTAQLAADLVIHNGFEACWSKAITKAQFLGLLKSSIDGTSGCLLYTSYADSGFNWEICNTPACPNGVVGCPLTLRAGTFNGNFGAGEFTATFSGPGTTDDINVPVTYYNDVDFGTCTLKFTNLTQTYNPLVYVQPDGNNGDYIVTMDPLAATFDTVNASSADPMCSSRAQSVISNVQNIVSGQSTVALYESVPGVTVCPPTP